jgi:hypothetical protein
VSLALTLLPSSAWADQPALKLSHLNFGNQPVGTAITVSLTATNRSDHPLFLYGGSLSALTEESGWYQQRSFYGSCIDLGLSRTPLAPADSCAQNVDIVLPPLMSDHLTLFRAQMCVFTELSERNCIVIRGIKNEN